MKQHTHTHTRKHQIEVDRVIRGIGSTASVTILRDAILSTALHVCLACAARVLGARYQRRETRENVRTTQPTDADMTAAILIPVAPTGVVRVVVRESEAISVGSTLNVSHGQMEIDSVPRRSETTSQTFRCSTSICGNHHTPQKCGVRTQGRDRRNEGH